MTGVSSEHVIQGKLEGKGHKAAEQAGSERVGVVPRSIFKFVPSFIVQIHRVTPYKMICKRNPVTTTKHQ